MHKIAFEFFISNMELFNIKFNSVCRDMHCNKMTFCIYAVWPKSICTFLVSTVQNWHEYQFNVIIVNVKIYCIKVYICHFKCGCRHHINLFGFISFLIANKNPTPANKTYTHTHAQQKETYQKPYSTETFLESVSIQSERVMEKKILWTLPAVEALHKNCARDEKKWAFWYV